MFPPKGQEEQISLPMRGLKIEPNKKKKGKKKKEEEREWGRGRRRRRRKRITSHWHLIDISGKLTRPSMGANIIVLFFILARWIYVKGPE